MLNELNQAIASDRKTILRKRDAFNKDLRAQLEAETWRAINQTKNIAQKFTGINRTETAKNVWRFVRDNFIYLQDKPQVQQLKMPSRLLQDLTGDCKSFSIFIYSILHNAGVPVYYKYASYGTTATPSHIYNTIIDDDGNEIIVDGTSQIFDYEKKPNYSFKKQIDMRIESLSDETMNILADEVLADETLSNESTKRFMLKLKKMEPAGRAKFLKRFAPHNRKRLVQSIKSFSKLQQLKRAKQAQKISDDSDGFFALGFSDFNQYDEQGMAGVQSEPLAGKKRSEKRAKKFESKAGKAKAGSLKQKKFEAKAMKAKGKATGNKQMVAEGKKARKGVVKERVKKVGKILAKTNPVLAAGRGAFRGMVALNMRGMASRMAEMIAKKDDAELRKKWENMGGKYSKLVQSINRGKKKKALFGKKKIKDEVLAYQTEYFDGIGVEPASTTAAVSTAVAAPFLAAIIPIIKKFVSKNGGNAGELDDAESEARGNAGKFGQILGKAKDFFSGQGKGGKVGAALGEVGKAGLAAIENRLNEMTGGESDADGDAGDGDGMSGGNTALYVGGTLAVLGLGYAATKMKKSN